MSVLHAAPRLVRMQDLLNLSAEDGPTWRINERTQCLEARCGLSYTGVRPYRTAGGIVRVLRRPEQVNSPGHLRTLRRLPGTDGHPADDVDVSPANYGELVVGWGGDLITVEAYNRYPRPVGDVSVMRPGVIATMVDQATWDELRERFPDVFAGVTRAPGAARTGTSLGYNALWYGPQVDAEIKSERDDGSLIGEWQGPHGPEEYDIEHYIDPDCEVVLKLAASTEFDPAVLGGQHIALNLERLGGRGAHQSELMRVVDSRELVITGDHVRKSRSYGVQVSCRGTGDAMPEWTVSADRDLPIASGDWDGAAAKESVFDWAGWPDSPDPAKARRAFLIHDASAADLKGSYKLPIARYRDGRLEVVDAGLRAAASRLPQTDAPQEVLDRAREVLDSYFEKQQRADEPARDRNTMATEIVKQKIPFGLGRDTLAKLSPRLAKRGIPLPSTAVLTVDMVSAEDIIPALESMQGIVAELLEMLSETEDAAAGAMMAKEEEMGDMMSKAEAEELIKLKEEELAAAKEALKSATDANAKLTSDNAKLDAALAPLRDAELTRLKTEAVALGADKVQVAAAADARAVKRVVIAARLGETYAKASDAAVDMGYAMALKAATQATGAQAGRDANGGGTNTAAAAAGLSVIPNVTLGSSRDANDGGGNSTGADDSSTSDELAASLGILG